MEIAVRLQEALEARDAQKVARIAGEADQERRKHVATCFEERFGEKLNDAIQSRLPSRYVSLLQSMFQDRYELWALAIKASIRGPGTVEKKLIPLVLLQQDEETARLKPVYKLLIKTETMIADIADDLSHNAWGKLLRAWMIGSNVHYVDPRHAVRQIQESIQNTSIDEDVFVRLLATTRPEAYVQTVELYKQQNEKDLETIIRTKFQNKAEFSFLLAHYYLIDPVLAVAFAVSSAPNDDIIQTITGIFAGVYRGSKFNTYFKQFVQDPAAHFRRQGCKIDDAIVALWDLE